MLKISAVIAGMLCVTRQGKKEVSVSQCVHASWHVVRNKTGTSPVSVNVCVSAGMLCV